MNIAFSRYVILPNFLFLDKINLKYLDVLTYASIKWFHNTARTYGHPTHEQIMKISGLGRTFIAQSIKRLEAAGMFRIMHSNRKGTANRYYSKWITLHERIPYELFEIKDLSTYEKAMLLCLKQFFNLGYLQTSEDITYFAKQLGLTYHQVYGRIKGLIAKGYIIMEPLSWKWKKREVVMLYLTDKISWTTSYSLPNIDLPKATWSIMIS